MNACLITGAILAVMLAFAHSFLGERFIIMRLLRRTELPHLFGSDRFTRQTLRFVWHLASVAWVGMAAVLVAFTLPDPMRSRSLALQAVSIAFLVHAFVAFFATRARHLGWIVFLAIALAAWLGIN